jgi:hypothetical protein
MVDKPDFAIVCVSKGCEAYMYRIVRRVVHTITTVTLFIRWEDTARRDTPVEEVVLPASSSQTVEEIIEETSNDASLPVNSNIPKGEKS